MNEFIKKLIERLEEIYNRNDKAKKEAYEEQDWEYFDLFTHRNEGVYTSISIVNQLAEEHKDDIQTIDVSELLGEQKQGNKSTEHINYSSNYERGYEDGWNDCMETIQASTPYQPKGE